MGTSFVIVGYDWKATLKASHEICSIQRISEMGRVFYRLQMSNDADYAIKKRAALSNMIGIPGDDVQQSGDYCTILLYETDDMENSWLEGFATSISNPELILDALSKELDTEWFSEHSDEYWELSDLINGESDKITDEDLPE